MLAALLLQRDAEPLTRVPTLAFVGAAPEANDPSFAGFRSALARALTPGTASPALRYFEGSDLDAAQLRRAVAAALTASPSVLVLPTGDGALAAASSTHDTPVVFASYIDPLRNGIVVSLRRPGRRTTGVWLGDTLDLKRLELIKLAFPDVRTVSMLVDSSWLSTRDVTTTVADAHRLLGLNLKLHRADTRGELNNLMISPGAGDCDAWYIAPSYVAYLAEAEIIAHLRRLQLPAMHGSADEVAAGALMAYSQDTSFAYDAMAQLTVRVALGEDAGSIPVQRPYRHTLSVRIEPDAPWAQIAPSVVRRADRVHRP